MTRFATWNNIGSDVSNFNNLESVLEASGINFNVKKTPLYTKFGEDLIPVEGVVSTVREDTGDILGIVGENYQVCQNRDAFDFINYIDSDVKYVKAGVTYSGLVYVIAELPEVSILGDSFKPHVIFQNGFNGGVSIKAAICPLRIICQNQFNIAFKESGSYVSIRHNNTMEEKLLQARDVLQTTALYMSSVNNIAESMAAIKLPAHKFTSIVEDLFRISPEMSDRQRNRIISERARLINAYNEDDNSNFRGTAWGAVNAYSDFITHAEPARRTKNYDENHFMAISFNGEGMNNFVNIVSAVA